jgi:ribosomal protein S18 acetylase RimI-like enzyme
MDSILQDGSTEMLVAANEANLLALLRTLGDMPGATLHEDAEITALYTGVPFPFLNGVVGTWLADDAADARIDGMLDTFRERDLPMLWWILPSTRPSDLPRRLEARGLVFAGENPGMAAPLGNLEALPPPNPAVAVERVGGLAELQRWLTPFAFGFEMPDFVNTTFSALMEQLGFEQDGTIHHFLGVLDGAAVACATLFLGAGVAGIYNVATAPEARRVGAGAAVTLAAMRMARDRGYHYAILQSSEMGLGVYRRLGFEEHCKVGHYMSAPVSEAS